MKSIRLPRPLSWSGYSLFKQNKDLFVRKYILNEDIDFTNDGIVYGKFISEILEGKIHSDDPTVQLLKSMIPKYDSPEHKLNAVLNTDYGDIPLMGKVDSYDKQTHRFREYKTGRTKWTQKTADKHGQIKFYGLMIWLNTGIMPEAYLDWIETEKNNGQVQLTGLITSFKVELTLGDITEFSNEISRVAQEISAIYKTFYEAI